MKKALGSIFITVILLLIAGTSVQAGIVGEVLHTDIVAYIDGLPIKSYNINGRTGIIAEDLRKYGYEVEWYPETRALYIEYFKNRDGDITADYIPEEDTNRVGSHAMDVYWTDIKTYMSDKEVEAFNIKGMTIIYMDALEYFGEVEWFEKERKICYTYAEPWDIRPPYTNEDVSDLYVDLNGGNYHYVDNFSWNIIKNENGDFISSGKDIEYLTNLKICGSKINGISVSFSLYQDVARQTEGLSSMLSDLYNLEDLSILNVDRANEHIKILINGKLMPITSGKRGPGNNHMDYVITIDKFITNDEVKTIDIICQ